MYQHETLDTSIPPTSFRVIVVGAGVAGLTAALSLQQAGIEYIVIEKNSTPAPTTNSSVTLFPNSCRILHQVGVLSRIKTQCTPMERYVQRLPDGTDIIDSKFYENISDEFNTHPLVLQRCSLLHALWSQVHDKSRLCYNVSLQSIITYDAHVTAILSNGTQQNASLIIGADGVHSTVREHMWDCGNSKIPDSITTAEKSSMKSTWKCLTGVSPLIPGIEPISTIVVHDFDHSILLHTQPTEILFSVCFKNDKPFTYPVHKHYTAADAHALASTVASHPVSKSVAFGAIWDAKRCGSLIDVEEGVLHTWHAGRMVLVGNSAHKFTPNAGLCDNVAIESVACLVNSLHDLKYSAESRSTGEASPLVPSTEMLDDTMRWYTESRRPIALRVHKFSNRITGLHAWDGWTNWFLARHVLPKQSDRIAADTVIEWINSSPWLEFAPLERGWRFGRANGWERRADLWKSVKRSLSPIGGGVERAIPENVKKLGDEVASSEKGILRIFASVVVRIGLGVVGAFTVADLCTKYMPGLWLPVPV